MKSLHLAQTYTPNTDMVVIGIAAFALAGAVLIGWANKLIKKSDPNPKPQPAAPPQYGSYNSPPNNKVVKP